MGVSSSSSSTRQLHPQQLTAAIKAVHSPEQLLQLLQQHTAKLNSIHLSAAYTHAVKLCKTGVPLRQQPAAVQQLLQVLHGLAEQQQVQCEARQLANIIWSCGRLSLPNTAELLLPVFVLDSNLQQATTQSLANVLWSAATLKLQLPPHQGQLLVQRSTAAVQHAKPQEVSITLWALATMQQQVPQQKLQQLVQRFLEVLLQANPQNVSNTLWALATMQQQVPQQQLQQMLRRILGVLPLAKPQDVSNTLWALATMQQQVAPQRLQQMLQRFQEVMLQAKPQEVSNTLWALATMQQQVPQQQLQQLVQRVLEVLPLAKPQDVSNTLWACGKLQHVPQQLLSALEQPQQLQAVLAAADPQAVANMAWACAQLGYKGKLLPAALLQRAVQLLHKSRRPYSTTHNFTAQGLCNLCWSVAVLDIQQSKPQLFQLAAAVDQQWDTTVAEDKQQLYQAQLWLLDSQLPAAGQGLSGVLSQQQLEQCRANWEQAVAASAQQRVTDLQQSVFVAVQRLPAGTWQQTPESGKLTADGAFSIDIAATAAGGAKVAIEVDGPTHFTQPGRMPDGGTQFRDRALAARGYVVISIPYWEWGALRDTTRKQQYLLTQLQPALQPLGSHQLQGQAVQQAVVRPAPAPSKRMHKVPHQPSG
jgi:hypothetical protein